jgi:hypothetical protein
LLQKIQELEASHSPVSLCFNNEERLIFGQWERIRVICQDFEIKNNKLYLFDKSNHTIVIRPKVSSFGDSCFSNCSNLTSIILPNSITSLGYECFYRCSNLTSINLPNSITSLGNDCFYCCSNLTSIILPNSITSLGNNCFYDCLSLYKPEFPNSLIYLHNHSFANTHFILIIKNQLIRDFDERIFKDY